MDDIINDQKKSMRPPVHAARRIQRVRHELVRRDVQVARVEPIGASFVSVTFTAESLAGFTSDSFDDHVKFMFDTGSGDRVMRDYTPRSFDRERRELTLEFAMHGDGAASNWARQAAVGQSAVIGGPRGSMIIPTDYAWHLLVGDTTALPAIHRRIEELPAGAHAIVVAHVDDTADRRPLTGAAHLDLRWVDSADALMAEVRALVLPPGEGFVWCAGEAHTMTRLRAMLLQEKSLPKEAMKVAVYWKQGATDFHETLDD